MVSAWLHVTALTVYLGSVVGLGAILLPALSTMRDPQTQARLLAQGLKLYNPLQIGSLGVLVISGAFQLTALKAAYRELLIREVGMLLAIKLSLAFVLIILSTYQAMGIGHRFVRRYEEDAATAAQGLRAVTRKLSLSTALIVAAALATALVGARMKIGP